MTGLRPMDRAGLPAEARGGRDVSPVSLWPVSDVPARIVVAGLPTEPPKAATYSPDDWRPHHCEKKYSGTPASRMASEMPAISGRYR